MRDLISGVVGGEIKVVGDVEIAFEDAFGAGPGVLVIAGTGSIAYGRNARGESARAGGWGHAISDEGSGYWIGVQATRAALRARDRGEELGLLRDLMHAMGATTFDELVVRVNDDPAPNLAALFPVVLRAADGGDSIAIEILDRAGLELASVAEVVIQRLRTESEQIPLATHGGVFASSTRVKRAFETQLRSLCSQTIVLDLAIDPARGALEWARRESRGGECRD
jgi:N-acetylglucosamine kinase-like BadF-type ATPase